MLFRPFFDAESFTYTYLLADEESREALIIDPVREQAERDLKFIRELGLKLLYILETHVHADHVTAASILRDWTGARTGVSARAEVGCVDLNLSEGQELSFGKHRLRVLETAGHTDSCLSFVVDERMVFTGDALLIRGTGRTDFQSGNARLLYRNIQDKLFRLDDRVLVYPAHDYSGRTVSSIGEERRFNPRLANKSEDEFATIMDQLKLAQPKKIHEALPGNLACGRVGDESPMMLPSQSKLISPDWTRNHMNMLQLLDVRELREWQESRIAGARHIPLGSLGTRLGELNPGLPTVVFCQSGMRSAQALESLRNAGFTKSWNLDGGLLAWRKSGHPVECGKA